MKYLRVDQVKFFKDCLLKTLLVIFEYFVPYLLPKAKQISDITDINNIENVCGCLRTINFGNKL